MPVMSATTQGNVSKSKIQPDKFDDIIPTDLNYQYIEPIKRPKWAYPLAWVGYVGTIFIVPFPLIMKNKDDSITANNQKYMNMRSYEQRYYSDIDKCNVVFKTDKELYKCYQEVKLSHQTFINGVRTGNIQEAQAELQRQQLQAQRYSNYLQMQQNFNQTQINNNLNNINNNLNGIRYGY
jgi:hypothetical protein